LKLFPGRVSFLNAFPEQLSFYSPGQGNLTRKGGERKGLLFAYFFLEKFWENFRFGQSETPFSPPKLPGNYLLPTLF
jgi:hypothetical protein